MPTPVCRFNNSPLYIGKVGSKVGMVVVGISEGESLGLFEGVTVGRYTGLHDGVDTSVVNMFVIALNILVNGENCSDESFSGTESVCFLSLG